MPKALKTPKVRYNLKDYLSKDGESHILAIFRYGDKKLKYYTGLVVKPKYWNKTGNAKESVNYSKGAEINSELLVITKAIISIYNGNKNIELEAFRNEIDYELGHKARPKENTNELTLYQFVEKLIEKKKKEVDGKHGQTWQKLKTVLKKLKAYADIHLQRDLEYDDIDLDFKDDFVEWLRDEYDHSENTIAKTIAVTKQFLIESTRYHSNMIVANKKFTHPRVAVPKEFPTLEELFVLSDKEFESLEVQKAIDLYLISAFGGGLRWSDIRDLSRENEITFKGKKVIQVFTYKGRDTKSDNEVLIPITPQLKVLLDKYGWKLPEVPYHNLNDLVRDGFKLAGLDRRVQQKSGIKGTKPVTKKLYEVVHFHTARYAYITYMINDMGVSAERLAKVTGQSLKVLLKYEQGDKKKNAVEIGDQIHSKLVRMRAVHKNEAIC